MSKRCWAPLAALLVGCQATGSAHLRASTDVRTAPSASGDINIAFVDGKIDYAGGTIDFSLSRFVGLGPWLGLSVGSYDGMTSGWFFVGPRLTFLP